MLYVKGLVLLVFIKSYIMAQLYTHIGKAFMTKASFQDKII